MYVIAGATGNTGKVIAELLLAKGQKVRVISRSADKLQPFVNQGAEAFVGSLDDSVAMTRAFSGATAVYVMIPPDITAKDFRATQDRTSDALAAAIAGANVSHAVSLSSVGADKSEKTGPVVGLHQFEEKLNRIANLNVLHLRAGYFMENLLPQMGVIHSMGMMAGPLKGDLQVAMIATRDIGAAAAAALQARDFTGKQTRELLGQRDVTMNEAAAIIGKAIAKPGLSYSKVPDMMLKPALKQLGMSSSMVDLLLEMAGALNSGYMTPLENRSAANTTPTSIENFVADIFVPAFRGNAAGA
ncbi:MAG: NmrA family NAD(P)-binding protein [Acidipila sp.]|nr:NmrA family NAD(P)-binding protein [Acidipila sp.]